MLTYFRPFSTYWARALRLTTGMALRSPSPSRVRSPEARFLDLGEAAAPSAAPLRPAASRQHRLLSSATNQHKACRPAPLDWLRSWPRPPPLRRHPAERRWLPAGAARSLQRSSGRWAACVPVGAWRRKGPPGRHSRGPGGCVCPAAGLCGHVSGRGAAGGSGPGRRGPARG